MDWYFVQTNKRHLFLNTLRRQACVGCSRVWWGLRVCIFGMSVPPVHAPDGVGTARRRTRHLGEAWPIFANTFLAAV